MSAVPLAILVAFAVGIVGGFKPTLRSVEMVLWSALDWIKALIS
jgi:hypothetical protein